MLPVVAPGGEPAPPGALAVVDVHLAGVRRPERYALALVTDGPDGGLREAADDDAVWLSLALAIAEARTIPALPKATEATALDPLASGPGVGRVDAALVCRPSPGFAALVPEGAGAVREWPHRALGQDQSNTSAVLGERLLLKTFRRLAPGLNPDLEMTAFLSEEVGFGGVPRLAGWAELVDRDGDVVTIALLEEFVADADDAYEATAEQLTEWILAPGEVSLEWATEVAAGLGRLTASLHAALLDPPADAVDFAPRPATRAELRAWGDEARGHLDAAVSAVGPLDPAVAAELRRLAPDIAARFTRFDALPTMPLVARVHGDLHLGQVLFTPDGPRIVDFEGEPTRPVDDRRRHDAPLRDVASMLRSLDHVGRSARRRAGVRAAGDPEAALDHVGLDIDAWLVRARERFLAEYRAGLRDAGARFDVDDDLLEAFEFAKEAYEFVYAATWLPAWLWAPRDGMRGLFEVWGGGAA